MAHARLLAGFSFSDHVALLNRFLNGRREVVDRIAALVSARRTIVTANNLSACFFSLPGLPADMLRMEGALAARRRDDGLHPVEGRPNGECDPVELVARARAYWSRNQWPGRNRRVTYAEVIYSVSMLQHLEDLWLRVWDDRPGAAPSHASELQALLDRLNEATPRNAPIFVRDARWLLQTAQSPITQDVRQYFVIARHVRQTLPDAERLEIHRAGAKMAGGHLRTQMRIGLRATGWRMSDPEFLAAMRSFSAVDYALLLHDLVPLLEAYKAAIETGGDTRHELADAILQAVSSDPDLFVTRLDLLAPYTTLEGVFIDHTGGRAVPNDLGAVHADLLQQYSRLIGRLKDSLTQDAIRLDPSKAPYSPLGLAYGFGSELFSNIALSILVGQSAVRGSLEDAFKGCANLEQGRALVSQWEAVGSVMGERPSVEYSCEFGRDLFDRLMRACHTDVQVTPRPNGPRLFLIPRPMTVSLLPNCVFPEGAAPNPVACLATNPRPDTGAIRWDRQAFLNDKNEGRYLASCESDDGWFGVPKGLLTLILGQGHDALVIDVPQAAIDILHLTYPNVVVLSRPQSASPRRSMSALRN